MNLTHTPVSKLETSLADLEPIYETIAAAQARLIAKGSCLDGLYSVGILLQYIARLKETIGPWETWKHDYFAMKQRAQTAEYAAQDVRHTALEIEVAKDERIIQWQNNNAVMQTQLQQAEAAANHAERALHKFMAEYNDLKAENKIISDNAVAQPSTERELQIAALRQDVRLKFGGYKTRSMAEAAAWFQLEHLLDQGDELHAAYNALQADKKIINDNFTNQELHRLRTESADRWEENGRLRDLCDSLKGSVEEHADAAKMWQGRHERLQAAHLELDVACQKTEKKLEFAAALNAKLNEENVGFRDELAEQEKQKLVLTRELAASEKYRRLLTKAILHTTPTKPAV